MEIGSSKDPSRLQCVSHSLRTTVVITWHPQTELAINTHVTVSEILTTVSDTRTAVSDIRTMVSDLHRGQEGNSAKLSVSDVRTPDIAEWLLTVPQTQARSVI